MKHLGWSFPVWKVRWLDTGALATTLVSISTDGRVTRWDTAKGLEFDDLMKLKRTVRREAAAGPLKASSAARGLKQEAFISRLTAGTAFDVSAHDERVYIAGAAPRAGAVRACGGVAAVGAARFPLCVLVALLPGT